MRLTDNFEKWEFESKDGNSMPLEVLQNVKRLANALQVIRDRIKKRIDVNSGYRSPAHNRAVGGAPGSTHLTGKGADIRATGLTPVMLKGVIEGLIEEGLIPQGGLKAYATFVHYDIRGTKARW